MRAVDRFLKKYPPDLFGNVGFFKNGQWVNILSDGTFHDGDPKDKGKDKV